MLRGKFGKVFQKVFLILAGIAFFWATGSRVFTMIMNPEPEMPNQTTTETPSLQEQLRQSVKGYQAVLQREPDNRFALEKLAEVYLQLGDLQAALQPTEKLVKLYPDNQRYQEVLQIIKTGLAQETEKGKIETENSGTREQK